MLVQNPKKLEHRSKLCFFIGYPKESRGGLFYDPQENDVFVSTNATFLEKDHIRDHQPRSKLVLNENFKSAIDKPSSSTKAVDKTRKSGQSHNSQELKEPRRSGSVNPKFSWSILFYLIYVKRIKENWKLSVYIYIFNCFY